MRRIRATREDLAKEIAAAVVAELASGHTNVQEPEVPLAPETEKPLQHVNCGGTLIPHSQGGGLVQCDSCGIVGYIE